MLVWKADGILPEDYGAGTQGFRRSRRPIGVTSARFRPRGRLHWPRACSLNTRQTTTLEFHIYEECRNSAPCTSIPSGSVSALRGRQSEHET